ncbi:hypothetical protein O3P69_006849 [Scylla paramamosain]|uniref:Uncharacterized protein n=1 Tax=Scylla paramamosain TaxID=85552 RepID=A0AAW0U603_SCYPA
MSGWKSIVVPGLKNHPEPSKIGASFDRNSLRGFLPICTGGLRQADTSTVSADCKERQVDGCLGKGKETSSGAGFPNYLKTLFPP